MFGLSPRRSQRSKGCKVKHALQVALLLGVSIWLLYQLKHSQENKTVLTEGSMSVNDVFKLGRKYLHPHKDETSVVDSRHREDEGDEESKNEVLKYRPDEMDDNNVGEAEDTVDREHDQDKDKGSVDQEKETQVSDEHADPVKEIGEHNTNDTEEKMREDSKENIDKGENEESKEDDKGLSEKIEVNKSERADHIENISTVNQNEESKDSVHGQGKANENENEQTKDQAEKADDKNVEKNHDRGEAKDGVEGSQEQEQNKDKEKVEGKIEDPITTDDHVQHGNDRKVEEAKQEDNAGDNSSTAVENQIQHVLYGNSAENVTNNTEVVNDTRNQNVTSDEDWSKNEEKNMDTSQTSLVTETYDQLQEKHNSVIDSAGTLNPSVRNGTESAYSTGEKQIERTDNRTSEGDNSNLQNIEVNQTPESTSAATSEQSNSASSSGATDADAATSGAFEDTTTHPELHDNSTQTNKSSGDGSYSVMRETSESSDVEKTNNNPTEEGMQESIVLSDTNGNVHAAKDEQVASSDTALESKRKGPSTSDNSSGAGQSKNGHVNAANTSSLNEDASAGTGNTDENVVIRMADENGNIGQNESNNYQQENEASRSDVSMPRDVIEA